MLTKHLRIEVRCQNKPRMLYYLGILPINIDQYASITDITQEQT
jgi:hypothetical protein